MSTGHDRPPVNMQRTHRQTDSWTDRQTNFRHRYYFVPHNICCKGVLKKAALLQVGSTQTQSEWLEGIEEKIQKVNLHTHRFPVSYVALEVKRREKAMLVHRWLYYTYRGLSIKFHEKKRYTELTPSLYNELVLNWIWKFPLRVSGIWGWKCTAEKPTLYSMTIVTAWL